MQAFLTETYIYPSLVCTFLAFENNYMSFFKKSFIKLSVISAQRLGKPTQAVSRRLSYKSED